MATESRTLFGERSGGQGEPDPEVARRDPVVPFVQAVTSAFFVRVLGRTSKRTALGGGWSLGALSRGARD